MNKKQWILVTGGAGYIGSHACVELLSAGYGVIVIDNLSNSKVESLNRVKAITGKGIEFFQNDIRDKGAVNLIFNAFEIYAVMHFAGLKSVGESCEKPLEYYQNNVYGAFALVEVMNKFKVKNIIFSSSATVYGQPNTEIYTEKLPTYGATNPYGKSKAMIEEVLRDLAQADELEGAKDKWHIILLRYFNPIGAHESGMMGEDPNGVPNNLVPYINQVAIGKLKRLQVYGNDYATIDGTGVRDYIHVVDLVKGHIQALKKIDELTGCNAYNLGTGRGYSVLEVISEFEKITGKKIPYDIVARRAGDIAACYANVDLAYTELNWRSEKTLMEMLQDGWVWQENNPNGYDEI